MDESAESWVDVLRVRFEDGAEVDVLGAILTSVHDQKRDLHERTECYREALSRNASLLRRLTGLVQLSPAAATRFISTHSLMAEPLPPEEPETCNDHGPWCGDACSMSYPRGYEEGEEPPPREEKWGPLTIDSPPAAFHEVIEKSSRALGAAFDEPIQFVGYNPKRRSDKPEERWRCTGRLTVPGLLWRVIVDAARHPERKPSGVKTSIMLTLQAPSGLTTSRISMDPIAVDAADLVRAVGKVVKMIPRMSAVPAALVSFGGGVLKLELGGVSDKARIFDGSWDGEAVIPSSALKHLAILPVDGVKKLTLYRVPEGIRIPCDGAELVIPAKFFDTPRPGETLPMDSRLSDQYHMSLMYDDAALERLGLSEVVHLAKRVVEYRIKSVMELLSDLNVKEERLRSLIAESVQPGEKPKAEPTPLDLSDIPF